MTAAHAAQIADRYAEIIGIQTRSMVQMADPWPAAMVELSIKQSLSDSPVVGVNMPPVPKDPRKVREMTYMAQDAGVRRLWMRGRIAYSIDPDLWEQLKDTSEKTELPDDLFSKLPHPDPFVALPQPLILPLTDGKLQQRIEGFFVTGRGLAVTGGASQISTHSRASSGDLGLLIVGPTETLAGKPYMLSGMGQDAVLTRVTLRRGIKTLAGHIEDITSRFDFAPYSAGDRSDLARSLTACVSALIYICARNAEMRPVPAATIKRAAKGLVGKPPRVIEVGYDIGPKLRAYKRREAQAERGPGTGRTVKAHIRRAHLHTFKVGPGRQEIDVKWLDPIFVNTEDPKTMVKDKTTAIGVE